VNSDHVSRGRIVPQKTISAIGAFALVGTIGFLIEAVVLTSLVQFAVWPVWKARGVSFSAAVLITWMLNRRFTFAGRARSNRSAEALVYTVIQVCGAVINLGIFGMTLRYFPNLQQYPVIPLGIGATGGFAFNFAVSNTLLYARERK
jgi:putative flippase GtrA